MAPKFKIDDKVKLINGDDYVYTIEQVSVNSPFFYELRQDEKTPIKEVAEYLLEEA